MKITFRVLDCAVNALHAYVDWTLLKFSVKILNKPCRPNRYYEVINGTECNVCRSVGRSSPAIL